MRAKPKRCVRKTEAATQQTRAREHELNFLRIVLEEAIVGDSDNHKVIRSLLYAADEVLNQPNIHIALLLREWEGDALEPQQESREIRYDYSLGSDGRLLSQREPNISSGLGGRAMITGQLQRLDVPFEDEVSSGTHHPSVTTSIRAERHMPIHLGDQVIGVFSVTSLQPHAFDPAEERILGRLAAVASLALGHVRRQDHLQKMLEAIKAVTAPTSLQKTLDAVIVAARGVAPGLSALTIWYKELENQRIVLGSFFGVHNHNAHCGAVASSNCVVARTNEALTAQFGHRQCAPNRS